MGLFWIFVFLVIWCCFGFLGGRCWYNLICIFFGFIFGCKKLFGFLVDWVKIGMFVVDVGGLFWKIFGRMSSFYENMFFILEYFCVWYIVRGGWGKVFGSFVFMVLGLWSGVVCFVVFLFLRRCWLGREWVGDGYVDGGWYGWLLWGNDRWVVRSICMIMCEKFCVSWLKFK